MKRSNKTRPSQHRENKAVFHFSVELVHRGAVTARVPIVTTKRKGKDCVAMATPGSW